MKQTVKHGSQCILVLAVVIAVISVIACTKTPVTTAGTTIPPTATQTATATSPTTSTTPPVTTALTINVSSSSTLGAYLVDGNGRTLYWTTADAVGKSNVSGNTLTIWPVFYTQNISVPSSLNASDFSSITRSDGSPQTTFRGWPLYYYVNDAVAGDTKGQGLGGKWSVVSPSASAPQPINTSTTPTTTTPATSTTTTSTPTATTTTSGNAVTIANFAFSPATIIVSAGTTVTWTNKDSTTHTVTSDTGAFNSGNLAPNATFSYTFSSAGTFAYHCAIHPYMTGKVVVQ